MKQRINILLTCWLLGTTVHGAKAALVELDLITSGDAAITRDTRTGLDWLDLDQTTGWSLAQAAGSTLVTDQGFRLATASEVDGLWESGGLDATVFDPAIAALQTIAWSSLLPSDDQPRTTFNLLEPLLGETRRFSFMGLFAQDVSGLFVGDENPLAVGLNLNTSGAFKGVSSVALNFDPAFAGLAYDDGDDDIGVYLVRDTAVPGPMSILLLLAGFAGLGTRLISLRPR